MVLHQCHLFVTAGLLCVITNSCKFCYFVSTIFCRVNCILVSMFESCTHVCVYLNMCTCSWCHLQMLYLCILYKNKISHHILSSWFSLNRSVKFSRLCNWNFKKSHLCFYKYKIKLGTESLRVNNFINIHNSSSAKMLNDLINKFLHMKLDDKIETTSSQLWN